MSPSGERRLTRNLALRAQLLAQITALLHTAERLGDEDTAGPNGPEPAEGMSRELTPLEVDLLVTLARTIQRRYPGGLPPWTHEQAATYSERMVDAYPDAGVVDDVIGPAYTTRGLARYWEASPATVRRRARAGKLLALKTTRGALVYPEFQLDRDGDVVAGLREVVTIITRRFPDPWDRARWLATPSEPPPIWLLRAGDTVAALARAQQLASTDEVATPNIGTTS